MQFRLLISALILLFTISFQSNAEENDTVVATVNGHKILQSTLDLYTAERQQVNPDQPIPKATIINNLVDMMLLNEQALKNNLDKLPEYTTRVNFISFNLLSQLAMNSFLDKNTITEATLKEEYDARIGKISFSEYKASHILLKDNDTAKKVIGELDKGSDFAALAKKYSTGPSGKNGGDLGWFNPKQMVPEFSQVVTVLKDKEYTKQAVQTQFGWHVILRTATRKGTPPTFEQTKPSITAFLEQKNIQQHLLSLRKSAKIDIKK